MSTGRVSSRDAERATLATVATNAAAGNLDAAVSLRLGERREVLDAERADMERRGPGHDLDVLLGRAQLERHGVAGQRADDVDQEARGQHDRAVADDLADERHAQADLHVGGAQLDRPAAGEHLDARQRLHRAAGGSRSGDDLQLREQLLALSGKSHLLAQFKIRIGRFLNLGDHRHKGCGGCAQPP